MTLSCYGFARPILLTCHYSESMTAHLIAVLSCGALSVTGLMDGGTL